MTSQQAKEILLLYRPGTADDDDPEFAGALQLCERDPELQRWFDEHRALFFGLRDRFKASAVPAGLKDQILAERKVHTAPLQSRRRLLLAVAAIAVLAGLVIYWLPPSEDISYAAYRGRMVSTALRNYGMALATNDHAQIRTFLNRYGAPSDYILPQPLRRVALTGCAIEPWQGAKVSMVCFDSGQPHPPGQANDIWLFVIDSAGVRKPPAASAPIIAKVNRASTATWSTGGRTYLLVVDGDEQTLRKYL